MKRRDEAARCLCGKARNDAPGSGLGGPFPGTAVRTRAKEPEE